MRTEWQTVCRNTNEKKKLYALLHFAGGEYNFSLAFSSTFQSTKGVRQDTGDLNTAVGTEIFLNILNLKETAN